jgi:hypothetical protein
MNEEISGGQICDNTSYDDLLKVARGSAKVLIPKMCAALKRENPNYSNCDIREIVTKDCISVWQKATIRDALPEEYKERVKQEAGRIGREKQLEQASGLVTEGEHAPDENRAESGSFGPVKEDFEKMNSGQGVRTQSERIEKLEKQPNEQVRELEIVKKELEIVKEENRILKEKTMPEIFKEMQDKFYDEPGIIDAKRLHKINIESGRNLRIMFERYNIVLQNAVEKGLPVPFGMYALTKPDMKLVPVRIMVDFNRKTIRISLWEKKVQGVA